MLRNKLYKAEESYVISSTPTAFLQNRPHGTTLNAECRAGFRALTQGTGPTAMPTNRDSADVGKDV